VKEIRSIKDLTPDPRNLNRGTQRGRGMLEQSLRKYGAGRSILVDKNGVVIAGNKVSEIAGEIDLPVREVQTRGNELVVVRRMDLDLEKDKAAKELAVADNRIGQIDLDWNPDLLKELSAEIDLGQFWMEDELKAMLDGPQEPEPPEGFKSYDENIETEYQCPKCGYTWSGRQK